MPPCACGQETPRRVLLVNSVTPQSELDYILLMIMDTWLNNALWSTLALGCLFPAKSTHCVCAHQLQHGVPEFQQAANGLHIQEFGLTSTTLYFNSREFRANVRCGDISQALLSMDFLHHHRLLVDVANRCLVDAECLELFLCTSSPVLSTQHLQLVLKQHEVYSALLSDFPEVTAHTFKSSMLSMMSTTIFPELVSLFDPTHGTCILQNCMQLERNSLDGLHGHHTSLLQPVGISTPYGAQI